MAFLDQDFKNLSLREIRFHRDRIQQFLENTYTIAENAVDNLFTNKNDPDFLKKLDEMNTLLKDCREKLITVANSLPHKGSISSLQNTQVLPECPQKLQVPKMRVAYNTPYLVKLLLPGSPSRFWLNLESTSTEKIEQELALAYSGCACLENVPCPGNFVVCLSSGKYCRGKVVTTLEFGSSNPQVDVILVDYGNTVTTSTDQLFPIFPKFCIEPAHGLLCCLHGIESPNESWDLPTIVFFMSQCKNITAIFHQPPDDETGDGSFSKYLPDFYVSLHKREGGEDSDIKTLMIKLKMGTSTTELPRISPVPGKSSKEDLKAKMGTTFSEITPCAPTDLSSEILKLQKLDLSTSKKPSPATQNPQVTQELSPENVLYLNILEPKPYCLDSAAPSLKRPPPGFGNFPPPSNIFFQNEITLNSNIASTSTEIRLSSCTTDEGTKIRAIPPNFPNNFSNKNCSPATDAASVEDVVDMLLQPPPKPNISIKSSDSDYISLDHIPVDTPIYKRTDELLMEQFLDSLNAAVPAHVSTEISKSDAQSYVTATSPCNASDQEWLSHGLQTTNGSQSTTDDNKKTSLFLDYQYGAVLKSKRLSVTNKEEPTPLRCCFSYVKSPSEFYVHLRDEIGELVEPLCEKLKKLYLNSQKVPVTQPEVGSFWVIQESQTKFWSRAKILSISIGDKAGSKVVNGHQGQLKPTLVTVFLVDWGYVDVVEVSELRPLVNEVLGIPCLAHKCRLGGIFPVTGTMDSQEWSVEVTEKFIELAGGEKEFSIWISPELREDGALSVVMFQSDGDEKFSVNELLVLLGLASSDVFKADSRTLKEPKECVEVDWDPMSEDFYSPMNTISLNTENYDSVTTGYIPQDEEKICRFFKAHGSCYKGIRCDQLHSNEQSSAFTKDRIQVCIDIPSLPSLVSGSIVSVQVTCVTNAYRFYVVLPHGTKDLQNLVSIEDEYETLDSMQLSLKQEYNANYYLHRVSINPSAGDVVIAKSPEDDEWYRGRVVEDEKNGFFGIYFLDFGNSQLVHMRNICNILPRFVHLPAQAVEMFLNGIDTSGKSDTDEARTTLKELVQNRDLVARIVHEVPYVCVDLYDTIGSTQVDIAAEMIRRKVALPDKRKQSSHPIHSNTYIFAA